MKPTRSLPDSWLKNLPKERRMALVSLTFLILLLGSLVLYQRFTMLSNESPLPVPGQDLPEEMGMKVEQPAPADGVTVAAQSPITKLSQPFGESHKVLLSYGSLDRAMGDMRLYPGIAYVARTGEPVLAAGPGTVSEVEAHPLDGLVLTIDHGNNLMTRYAGLGKLMVAEGAQVSSGVILGQIGTPGPARAEMGPHLQLQVLVHGEPVNPASYFPN